MIIKLVYANIRQWGIPQQKAVYTYEIDWLEESKFKVVETVSQNATSRVVQDRHGKLCLLQDIWPCIDGKWCTN